MGDNKRIWIPTKLVNSIYWQDVCNLVAAGKEPAEIHKFLNEEKEYKISLPAVRGAVNYIKVHGQSALQVAKVSKSIGLKVNEHIKENFPILSDAIKRRSFTIKDILAEIEKAKEAQKEGNRVIDLSVKFEELLEEFILGNKTEIENKIYEIKTFIKSNFSSGKYDPSIASIIIQWHKLLHEEFKYAENFMGRMDIYNLLEKVAANITESAVEVFGPSLKNEDEESRILMINNFKSKVINVMNKIKSDDLKLEDKENSDMFREI